MVALSSVLNPVAQNSINIQKVWKTIDVNSCPYHYNFHLHTTASDGQLTPSALIEQALQVGLKGLAITDHHSVNGYQQAQRYLNQLQQSSYTNQLILWAGVEITSRLLGVDVHILGYAFDIEHSAIQKYLQSSRPEGQDAQAKEVINCIHQAGGLAVLAHPHRYRRSAKELIPAAAAAGVDGAEVYYAYKKSHVWIPTPDKTEEAFRLAAQYNLYHTCGTDSHGLSLLQRV